MNYANNQLNQDNQAFQNIINNRNIKHLVHFTKSSNLPFIFGNDDTRNGILSSEKIAEYFGNTSVWDKNRFDNCADYVCCSVEHLNESYYKTRVNEEKRRGDIFNQWTAIFINPGVIDSTSKFCPFNAATGSGRYIQSGVNAFESLFADEVSGVRSRGAFSRKRVPNLSSNLPTDNQAEVLIKNRIPKNALMGVAFPDDSVKVEIERLKFWSTEDIPVFSWQDCTKRI